MKSVHIVIYDQGWIIEKLARRLANALEYVSYDVNPNPHVDLQYYMPYLCYNGKISPKQISFFTHIESDPTKREKFFNVAKSVDYCICQSKFYEEILRKHGVSHITTISPGVDLSKFIIKIRIGVVGRTYDSGRKGETIVTQVMDIPEIEWIFTGSGWPKDSKYLTDDEIPEFYNSVDYVLVPSLYEGGPMCVAEASGCGREVIAPPVGWVREFPHIEYETGNVDSLRKVLLSIVEKRKKLRESVLLRTWHNWIDCHDRLFRNILD